MDSERKFSNWIEWRKRNETPRMPGIYCIAVCEKDISDTPFEWIDKIEYIGMTNAKSRLKGRLKQFDDTIKGKTGHGGADRFRYKNQYYNKIINKLFVAVKSFECTVKSIKPKDLLVMGEVAKHEFVCFAEFASRYGRLPKFNDKKNAKKYSLTIGRGLV